MRSARLLCRLWGELTACDAGDQGSPRTDKMFAAFVQWAERIMARIDAVDGRMK